MSQPASRSRIASTWTSLLCTHTRHFKWQSPHLTIAMHAAKNISIHTRTRINTNMKNFSSIWLNHIKLLHDWSILQLGNHWIPGWQLKHIIVGASSNFFTKAWIMYTYCTYNLDNVSNYTESKCFIREARKKSRREWVRAYKPNYVDYLQIFV